jgi:hypothetical protein
MIIVSQDKQTIVNFDNLRGVAVCEWAGEAWDIRAQGNDSDDICLGDYTNNADARNEIFKIIRAYKNGVKVYFMDDV